MARVTQSTPKIYAKREEQRAFHNEPILLLETKDLDATTPSTTNNKDHNDLILEDSYCAFEKGLMWKFVSKAGVDLPLASKRGYDFLSSEASKRKTEKGNCLSESSSISELEELDSKRKFHIVPQDTINMSYGSSYSMSVDESNHSLRYDQNHGNSSSLLSKRKKDDSISTSAKDSSSEDECFKRKLLHKKRKATAAVTPTSSEYFKENAPFLHCKNSMRKERFTRFRIYSPSESGSEDELIDEIFNFSALNSSSSPQNALSEIKPTFSNVVDKPNRNRLHRKLDSTKFHDAIPIGVIMARHKASEMIQEVGLSRNFRKKCTLNQVWSKYPPKRKFSWRRQFKITKKKNYLKWKKVRVGSSHSANGKPGQLINSESLTESASGTKSWRKNGSNGVLKFWENKHEAGVTSLELENMSYSSLENSESKARSVYVNPEKMFLSVLENQENMSFSIKENLETMSFETTESTENLNARKC